MRYKSKCLEIKVIVSGSGLLFKDMKICLGHLNTDTKQLTLFQGNHNMETSAIATNRITPSNY